MLVGGPLTKYQKETFVWLGCGLFIILVRIALALKIRGIKGLYLDDYLIVLAGFLFATESYLSFTIGHYGTNNMRPELRAKLSPEMVTSMEYGSRLLYGGWFVYFSLLWTLKWCMICFYRRLTLGLRQAKFLTYISYFIALSPIAIVLTLIFNCFPVENNWRVLPDPGVKCTQGWAYFAVTGLPNVVSEFFLLLIPIPLLLSVQLSLGRKIPLAVLLSLGVFIILATILRHVAIFRDIYDPRQVTIWATREAFTSILVNCAAQLKPISDFISKKLRKTGPLLPTVKQASNFSWTSSTSQRASRSSEKGLSSLNESTSENESVSAPTPLVGSQLVINQKTSWAVTMSESSSARSSDVERGFYPERGQSISPERLQETRLPSYQVMVGTGRD